MQSTEVFLCYRRFGAQTAKLFYRYLKENNFPSDVWYSDISPVGNFKNDIDSLIGSASCIVLFVDKFFTKGFLDDKNCITALEISAIARKKLENKDTLLLTVLLDKDGFDKEDNDILKELFRKEGIPLEAVDIICQNNPIKFQTSTDYEEELFKELSQAIYSSNNISKARGDFSLGHIDTTAEIIAWDNNEGIKAENVNFILDIVPTPLYEVIKKKPVSNNYEQQNNIMVSLTKCETFLSDDTESKNINVYYKQIEYKLFSKSIHSWDSLRLDKTIASYTKDQIFPIPNAMGMAFMVITKDKKLIFTKRSKNRKIRPDEYDCSIVEGLKPEIYQNDEIVYSIDDYDFLHREIERSFKEEMCAVDNIDYKIYGVILDRRYGQWNFVGTIKTDLSADEIIKLHSVRDDSYEDNFLITYDFLSNGLPDKEQLRKQLKVLFTKKIWGMALTTLYAALKELGYSDKDILDATKDVIYYY